MEYVYIHDFLFYFKEQKKFFITYLSFIVAFILFQMIIGIEVDDNLFNNVLGLRCTTQSNILEISLYIINMGFAILSSLIIFNNDIKNGIDNLFLRIKILKWIIAKLISIIFITILTKAIIYTIVFIIFALNKVIIKWIIIIFLKNILYTTLIQFTFLIFYIICKKNKFVIPILLIICLFSIKYLFVDISNLNEFFLLVSLFLISIIIIIIRKKIIYLFDYNGG